MKIKYHYWNQVIENGKTYISTTISYESFEEHIKTIQKRYRDHTYIYIEVRREEHETEASDPPEDVALFPSDYDDTWDSYTPIF